MFFYQPDKRNAMVHLIFQFGEFKIPGLASFCWASISKSGFLDLNTKLDDSYMFFDRFNDMNTMVESFMPFNKVSKLA